MREIYLPERHSAKVFRGACLLGALSRQHRGASFEYERAFLDSSPDATQGVAYVMPPRAKPYLAEGINLHPFFANLLPEGTTLLTSLARKLKTSVDDLLSIFVTLGADTIGDVWVGWEDDVPRVQPPARFDPAERSFAEIFEERYGSDIERIHRVSLPGVQPKMSAARIALPVQLRRYGECILKLSFDPRFPRAVENEHFFMRMARDCGIAAPPTAVVTDRDGTSCLVVRRFDRVRQGRRTLRLHAEDGCQLLDRYPADKYSVSTEELLEAIVNVASSPAAVLAALTVVAFSYAIGNHDLHAKNLSVVQTDTGTINFSPAYDLICTLVYGDPYMALSLNGKKDELSRADFISVGKRFGVPASAIGAGLDKIVSRAPAWLARLDEIGLPMSTLGLRDVLRSRLDGLAQT